MGIGKGVWTFVVVSLGGIWIAGSANAGAGNATKAVGAIVLAGPLGIAVILVVNWLLLMISLFVHELGHALAGVALSAGRPLIVVGEPPHRLRFRIGRIDVQVGPALCQAYTVRGADPQSRGEDLAIVAAGPLASCLLAGAWIYAAGRFGSEAPLDWAFLLWVQAAVQVWLALRDLVPGSFEAQDDDGTPTRGWTDGARIVAALRNKPLPPPPNEP
jgi:hypothetical protein